MDRLLDESAPSQAANELAVAAAMGGLGDLNENEAEGAPDQEDDSLSAKLLNNAAALHLRGGEKEAALHLIEEAVEVRQGLEATKLATEMHSRVPPAGTAAKEFR